MHTLLQQLLQKRNVNPKEMSPEEKQTFDVWESKLQGESMSLDKLQDFCRAQIGAIESQWENMDNSEKKNERLIILHTVYHKILKAITADERERVELEKYLTELIDNDTGQHI